MILNVSKRRYWQLVEANRVKEFDPAWADRIRGDYHDRERRQLVKGGFVQPTAEDLARIAKAQAKRQAKAAKNSRLAA